MKLPRNTSKVSWMKGTIDYVVCKHEGDEEGCTATQQAAAAAACIPTRYGSIVAPPTDIAERVVITGTSTDGKDALSGGGTQKLLVPPA